MLEFGSYKSRTQNRKAMRSGERRGNITNQAQNLRRYIINVVMKIELRVLTELQDL
jgi:hypothetical protein